MREGKEPKERESNIGLGRKERRGEERDSYFWTPSLQNSATPLHVP
jgi:hypothetical protein